MNIKNISPFDEKVDVPIDPTLSFVLEGEGKFKIEFFIDGAKIDERIDQPAGQVALKLKGLYEDTLYTWYVMITDSEGTVTTSDQYQFATQQLVEGNYYRRLYRKLMQAMIEGDASRLLLKETKRRRDVEQVYNSFGDLKIFLQWLKNEADKEDDGYDGRVLFSIGGSDGI